MNFNYCTPTVALPVTPHADEPGSLFQHATALVHFRTQTDTHQPVAMRWATSRFYCLPHVRTRPGAVREEAAA